MQDMREEVQEIEIAYPLEGISIEYSSREESNSLDAAS